MSARVFKRLREDDNRPGIWIMTRESGSRGAFFHGDHDDIEAPQYTVEELIAWGTKGGFLPVEEITGPEALELLSSWPQGKQAAKEILLRHGAI